MGFILVRDVHAKNNCFAIRGIAADLDLKQSFFKKKKEYYLLFEYRGENYFFQVELAPLPEWDIQQHASIMVVDIPVKTVFIRPEHEEIFKNREIERGDIIIEHVPAAKYNEKVGNVLTEKDYETHNEARILFEKLEESYKKKDGLNKVLNDWAEFNTTAYILMETSNVPRVYTVPTQGPYDDEVHTTMLVFSSPNIALDLMPEQIAKELNAGNYQLVRVNIGELVLSGFAARATHILLNSGNIFGADIPYPLPIDTLVYTAMFAHENLFKEFVEMDRQGLMDDAPDPYKSAYNFTSIF